MQLETEYFQYIGAAMACAAEGSAERRLGIVLEGGYNPAVLGACVLSALSGLGMPLDHWRPRRPTPQERAVIEASARLHDLA